VKVLEVTSKADAGSADGDHPKCSIGAMLNNAQNATLSVETLMVNGNHYTGIAGL
jgi:hypothetical protein